jgi:preprotein translocase subunit Sss1
MAPKMARQIAWFIGLWAAGVLAVGIVGLIIKLWLGA